MPLDKKGVFNPSKKLSLEEKRAIEDRIKAYREEIRQKERDIITDFPSKLKTERPLSERLRDGSTIIGDYCGFSDGIPFSEFYKRALNGEFDE